MWLIFQMLTNISKNQEMFKELPLSLSDHQLIVAGFLVNLANWRSQEMTFNSFWYMRDVYSPEGQISFNNLAYLRSTHWNCNYTNYIKNIECHIYSQSWRGIYPTPRHPFSFVPQVYSSPPSVQEKTRQG